MKPTQVKTTLKSLGLGLASAARLFRVTRMTVWQWKQDGTTGINAILLRLLASGKITVKDIEAAHD